MFGASSLGSIAASGGCSAKSDPSRRCICQSAARSSHANRPGVICGASFALATAPITRLMRGQLVEGRQTMAICRELRFC